ncbi:hypothetical protein EPA93_11670 [Ktedonosporobacter rubrisoli]|uniref:MmyB-like transcription regulator ligand binding domain-containing protein n=1 Tax=Ktedonosporobacter rubrisoli TaxID=2509675 RepID=A0A4P6JPD7_KTERU|nr:hypothetical protein [Ktedonosporobacter rubrisoli]QBD76626.1 hypothetical protein EPA93_11670 [Ktedonosporobacter rubrisoli]
MARSETSPAKRSDVLRDLLEEIEVQRLKKQEEVRDCPLPRLKRFTQQELADEACPTYKNLLVGRSLRMPSRQTLTRIANYLECSSTQRNNLLLAARYLPENLELEGDALQLALEQARHLMCTLPYPAMLVTHSLHVEAFNELFQRLFELPPLNTLPHTQRHVFSFFFRHDLPMRERSTFNDEATLVWQAGVSRSIHLFKHNNRLYQFEPWYQELVEQFCAIADIRQYWDRTPALPAKQGAPSKLILSRNALTEDWQPIQLQHIRISVCTHTYPCIMALLPLDEPARELFTSLGTAPAAELMRLV